MTDYTWNGLTGDWTVAANWTPTSGPPSSLADTADIAAAGSYVVQVGASDVIEVGSVTLDAATATLQVTGGMDAGAALNLAGTLELTSAGILMANSLNNSATVNADVAGGTATIEGTYFGNNGGTLAVLNGATLALNSSIFVNTGDVTIDSASQLNLTSSATIAASQASGGTVDIEGTLDANGATIDLGATSAFANTTLGGTLENAVIVSDGGLISYNLGTLDADTFQGTLTLGDSGLVTIINGLTVTGAGGVGPGVIDATTEGQGAGALIFGDTETLDNLTLNVGSSVGFDQVIANGASLTLGAHAVVNSVGTNGLDFEGAGGLVNDGLIDAAVSGGQATINTGDFDNEGTVAVTGGQTLTISAASFENTGDVTIDSASQLNLSTAVTIAASQASGGTVDIEGTLDANGATIDLGATSAFANTTLGGTLENAVIVSDGGLISYNLGTLDADTFQGTLTLGDSGLVTIINGLTVTGAGGVGPGVIDATTEGQGAGALIFGDTETLDNLTLNVGSSVGFDQVIANGASLTLGAHAVVNSVGTNGLDFEGAGGLVNDGLIDAAVSGGQATINTGDFDNAGTVAVTGGQTLTISAASFENTGDVTIDSASQLNLSTAVTIAASQASGGTVDIEGTLNAGGATIDLGSTSAFANTILGGTLENAVIVSDGGLISYNLGTLAADTVEGTLDLGNSGLVTIIDGLTVTGAGGTGPGVINVTTMGQGAAALIFGDTETLDNVTLNVGSSTGFDQVIANGASLTLAASVVVNSVGADGVDFEGAGGLVNDGLIDAAVSGGQATINTGDFDNEGTVAVTGGQTLTISAASFENTGDVTIDSASQLNLSTAVTIAASQASGGTVDIEGTLNAGGATIDLGATSAFAHTILGGTLENAVIVSDGGLISYDLGTLDADTVRGTLDLGNSGLVVIINGLTVTDAAGTGPGVINALGSGAGALIFGDTETLDNLTLNVGSSVGFDQVISNGASLTLGAHVVTNSIGRDGVDFEGPGALINNGTILGAVVGGVATINTGSFTNAGTIKLTNKQKATITSSATGTIVNTGTMTVGTGASLDIASAVTGSGRLNVVGCSFLELGGAVSSGQTISLQGTNTSVILDQPTQVAATFTGLTTSDVIDLKGVSVLTASVSKTAAGAVIHTPGQSFTLKVIGLASNQTFGLLSDGHGGSALMEGTVINGAAGGHFYINSPTGNAIITDHGIGNTITKASGDAVINAGGSYANVTIGTGNAAITLSGVGDKVTGGYGNFLVDGSASLSTIKLGDGNDLIKLSGSGDAIGLGNGANTVALTGNLDALEVGNGANSITVAGTGDLVQLQYGAQSVNIAGALDAVFLGMSHSTVTDSAHGLNVVAGVGAENSVLAGVTNDGHFVLDLTGGVGGYHTAAQALAALTSDGHGGSLLALGKTGSIDFAGVAANQLHTSNFNIVPSYHFA